MKHLYYNFFYNKNQSYSNLPYLFSTNYLVKYIQHWESHLNLHQSLHLVYCCTCRHSSLTILLTIATIDNPLDNHLLILVTNISSGTIPFLNQEKRDNAMLKLYRLKINLWWLPSICCLWRLQTAPGPLLDSDAVLSASLHPSVRSAQLWECLANTDMFILVGKLNIIVFDPLSIRSFFLCDLLNKVYPFYYWLWLNVQIQMVTTEQRT